jgi:DNA-binding LacI/PurR family transcriptional regulator
LPDIAKEGGWGTWEAVRRILTRKTITPETRERVAAVARALVAKGRGPSTVTAQRALAKGWVSPLAWDDIDNDPEPVTTEATDEIDEVAVTLACDGQKVKLNPVERREAVRRLHAERYTDPLIAETIGCGTKTALLIRQELGLKTWPYSELVKRGAA